jgi:glycosyltransferase involved in cell wall biosynthesis
LKILLSAYACEPGAGSEPGTGWHWAVEIARLGHEVHVLTRANNVDAVARGIGELDGMNMKVHGYDLPRWARWWKVGQRRAHLYYVLWQWGAFRVARKLHAREKFDIVHHITLGVYRHASFMGRLGIPFIFGPIGGGDCTPPALLRSAPWRVKIFEYTRSAGNGLASIDPFVRSAFSRATLIFCSTRGTKAAIPVAEQDKCICVTDVATDPALLAATPSAGSERPRFLFAGRLLFWKGVHLALRAMVEVRQKIPDAVLTVVNDGSERAWLEQVARQFRVDDIVDFRGRLPRRMDVIDAYASHTAFVFPSLHESGGLVVMEALSRGVPVICLDLGGPAEILPDDCGYKIAAHGRTEAQVASALAEAMIKIASDVKLRNELAANALAAAHRKTWQAIVSEAYRHVEKAVASG